jgi:pyruvate ferredoxin oxidoreductase alpha subunit
MPELLEGSQGVARAVGLCRPAVVCAYPISPQTHIVEALSTMVRTGELLNCDYLNVESEFAARSVAIGASAAGARVYTATASQGLLYMAEAVYNASGLKLPIVMTVANRALGAPINIWNDQSDSLSQRDSGWLQLFAVDNQEAIDLHVIAYKVAEELSLPVMVCMDGFVLTHASDVVEVPTQGQVDSYLPPIRPLEKLDIKEPRSMGMMAGPDVFTETKYLQHKTLVGASKVIRRAADAYSAALGRDAWQPVRVWGPDSPTERGGPASEERPAQQGEIAVIGMGSVMGTMQAAVPRLWSQGVKTRLVTLGSYRPFPARSVREAIGTADRVVVLDRALMPGVGGVLSADVRRSMARLGIPMHSVVAGLGGRSITERSLAGVLRQAKAGELGELEFMDLKRDLVEKAG